MRFSNRIPNDLSPSEWATLAGADERKTELVADLTVSNPTEVGLTVNEEDLRRVYAAVEDRNYFPSPRGLESARATISQRPDHVWLTSGTSEAYSFLFKLLADAGDEILVPTPSYPLFEHLLTLESISSVPYRLVYDRRWKIDFDSIHSALTSKTRTLIVVHPNNPTGSYLSRDEAQRLLSICAEKSIALIVDEVFLPYPHEDGAAAESFTKMNPQGLVFVLDGISKKFGLPQLKASWIEVLGPKNSVDEVAPRLDWISDLYLSVSSTIQRALPGLVGLGIENQKRILNRIRHNRKALEKVLNSMPGCEDVSGEGGWTGIIRLPDKVDEEMFCRRLLVEQKVHAYPGYFFDLPFQSSVVVSLLPETETFMTGIMALKLTL